jgi:hypothetical protein
MISSNSLSLEPTVLRDFTTRLLAKILSDQSLSGCPKTSDGGVNGPLTVGQAPLVSSFQAGNVSVSAVARSPLVSVQLVRCGTNSNFDALALCLPVGIHPRALII